MTPLGIRASQLGAFVGSEVIAREMVAAGWIKPIIQDRRLTLYDTADVIKAFNRLRTERPPRLKRYDEKPMRDAKMK